MLDIKYIRENAEAVKVRLATRGDRLFGRRSTKPLSWTLRAVR